MDNYFIGVRRVLQGRSSCILLHLSTNCFVSSSTCVFLGLSYLHSNEILSLAGKSSVHWGISPVEPSLDGRKNLIVAEAFMFTGASYLSRAS